MFNIAECGTSFDEGRQMCILCKNYEDCYSNFNPDLDKEEDD